MHNSEIESYLKAHGYTVWIEWDDYSEREWIRAMHNGSVIDKFYKNKTDLYMDITSTPRFENAAGFKWPGEICSLANDFYKKTKTQQRDKSMHSISAAAFKPMSEMPYNIACLVLLQNNSFVMVTKRHCFDSDEDLYAPSNIASHQNMWGDYQIPHIIHKMIGWLQIDVTYE